MSTKIIIDYLLSPSALQFLHELSAVHPFSGTIGAVNLQQTSGAGHLRAWKISIQLKEVWDLFQVFNFCS